MHVDATVEIDPWDALAQISTKELSEIVAQRRVSEKPAPGESHDPINTLVEDIDRAAMEQALWHWRAGRVADAVYFLEKALGRHWAGLADLASRRAA